MQSRIDRRGQTKVSGSKTTVVDARYAVVQIVGCKPTGDTRVAPKVRTRYFLFQPLLPLARRLWLGARSVRKHRRVPFIWNLAATFCYSRRDTIRSNYIIATFDSKCKKRLMNDHGKRSVQVNVRLSEEDFVLIKKAAAKLWPSAVLSNSGILLGLAKLAANEAFVRAKKQRGS